jgi:capsular polysaccharide biosynthesis protein
MTETATQHSVNDEIDLLDLLVLIAENIKLLVVGPLITALLAFGAVSFWPATYESGFTLEGQKKVGKLHAVDLFTPMQVSQLLVSGAVASEAAKELQNSGQTQWADLLQSGAVSVQVLRNTTRVQTTVKAKDPAAAHAVAQALLQAALAMSKPQGEAFQEIQTDLEKSKSALASARLMESRFRAAINSTDRADTALAQAYIKLLDTIPNLVQSIEDDRIRLNGLTSLDVLIGPSFVKEPVSPKLTVVLVAAILGVIFALLFWVFMREAYKKETLSSSSAAKIARTRKALGLKA